MGNSEVKSVSFADHIKRLQWLNGESTFKVRTRTGVEIFSVCWVLFCAVIEWIFDLLLQFKQFPICFIDYWMR